MRTFTLKSEKERCSESVKKLRQWMDGKALITMMKWMYGGIHSNRGDDKGGWLMGYPDGMTKDGILFDYKTIRHRGDPITQRSKSRR